MLLDRWRRRLGWDGTTGVPRSANAASSFHLGWLVPPGEWVEAEATVEVVQPPLVASLFFWALQASFADRGRHGGAAHLGLQWYPPHPGSTAVNWGGYGPGGGELTGSASPLPSATGNVNTRDLAWRPGQPYRLRIAPAELGGDPDLGSTAPPAGFTAWRGEVTDLTDGSLVTVRNLYAAGDRLTDPVVWSEVFARCDDPGAAVRWSGLRLRAADGAVHDVDRVRVNYQSLNDGGCATTDVRVDGGGVVQATGVVRRTPQGAVVALDPAAGPDGRAGP